MHTERPSVVDLEVVSELLSALSSSTKLAILFDLAAGAMTVGGLCRSLDLSQSLVSHHLSTLRQLGLVRSVRCKQCQEYRLGPSVQVSHPAGSVRLEARTLDQKMVVAVSIADRATDSNGVIQVSTARARSPSPST